MNGIFHNSSIFGELDLRQENLTFDLRNSGFRDDYVQLYSPVKFDPINITFSSGTEYWAVKPAGEIGNANLCSIL